MVIVKRDRCTATATQRVTCKCSVFRGDIFEEIDVTSLSNQPIVLDLCNRCATELGRNIEQWKQG